MKWNFTKSNSEHSYGISKFISFQSNLKKPEQLLFFSISILVFLSFFITPHMIVASFAYLCFFSGMILRRNKIYHPRLMMTGMATDIILVLSLEIQRSAVKTALGFSLNFFQQLHIVFSLIAVLYYVPVFYLGLKRLKGTATLAQQRSHIRLGVTALALRTLGFILMFSFLYHTKG